MTQTNDNHAPSSALSSPVRQRQTFAVVMLSLYFITYNAGSVFLQVRGVRSGEAVGSYLGFLCGAFIAAMLFDALERLPASRRRNSIVARATGTAMLLPGVLAFLLFSLESVPWSGTRLVNVLLPSLWGTCLPVALRLFFRLAPQGLNAWFFGIAAGVGHLCWSLLTPLASMLELPADDLLFFLNMLRILSNTAFAVLVWLLMRDTPTVRDRTGHDEPYPAHVSLGGGCRQTGSERPGTGGSGTRARGPGPVARLLLPAVAAYTLSGMMGYLFFSRMATHGKYMEYMHLGLAAAVPLLGLAISRRGVGILRPLLILSVACMATAPLLLLPAVSGTPSNAIFLACATAQQAMVTFSTLALSRFALRSRHPSLLTCAAWLVCFAALPGNLLAARLFPFLGLPPQSAAWIMAALCILSLRLIHQAFPLPSLPPPPPDAERTGDETRLQRFAATYGLSPREAQILQGILRGRTMEHICADLGIRESTVRYHLTGLLRKSGQKTRARLAQFYHLWEPE